VNELFAECREHGISILASMIVGFPYQTPDIIEEEMSELLALKPDFAQFLIYGPTPGTPFFDRVMREELLHQELVDDRELYYRKCDGFSAMVKHPTMKPAEIEAAQARCYEEDFRRQGPSIYRSIETQLLGYLKLKDSPNPLLRKKAQYLASETRRAYPVFAAGTAFGPTPEARRRVADLQRRIRRVFGRPTWTERFLSVLVLGLAAWAGLALKFGLFQHPRLIRHTFRMPEEAPPARVWRRLRRKSSASHQVEVELRPESTVWVRVEGRLDRRGVEKFLTGLREGLRRTEDRLVIDFARLVQAEREATERIAEGLKGYRDRIQLVMPPTGEITALAALFVLYR
jgi:hypothetical protein